MSRKKKQEVRSIEEESTAQQRALLEQARHSVKANRKDSTYRLEGIKEATGSHQSDSASYDEKEDDLLQKELDLIESSARKKKELAMAPSYSDSESEESPQQKNKLTYGASSTSPQQKKLTFAASSQFNSPGAATAAPTSPLLKDPPALEPIGLSTAPIGHCTTAPLGGIVPAPSTAGVAFGVPTTLTGGAPSPPSPAGFTLGVPTTLTGGTPSPAGFTLGVPTTGTWTGVLTAGAAPSPAEFSFGVPTTLTSVGTMGAPLPAGFSFGVPTTLTSVVTTGAPSPTGFSFGVPTTLTSVVTTGAPSPAGFSFGVPTTLTSVVTTGAPSTALFDGTGTGLSIGGGTTAPSEGDTAVITIDWLMEQLKNNGDTKTQEAFGPFTHSVEQDLETSLKDRFELSFGTVNHPSHGATPIGLDVLHCRTLVCGREGHTITFFTANTSDPQLSDMVDILNDRSLDLAEICGTFAKLPASVMLKFETLDDVEMETSEDDAVEMEVYGSNRNVTSWTVSNLLLGAPFLYKNSLIKTCEITAAGVERARFLGLHGESLRQCAAAGLPLIFQACSLDLDEQESIRQGLGELADNEVGYVHLKKCSLLGDRGTNPLVQINYESKEKYRNNFALCMEALEENPDMDSLIAGVHLGLYFSLSFKSFKGESVKDFLQLVEKCQQNGWNIQVGVTAKLQEKWVKKTLILQDVSIKTSTVYTKVDSPWLFSHGITGVVQMELLLHGFRGVSEIVALQERIESGLLLSLYLLGFNLPRNEAVIDALVDLLAVAASKGFKVKIGEWNRIDYGHKWLVLSHAKVALSEDDDEERRRRLEEYYHLPTVTPLSSVEEDLILYSGRIEELQNKLKEEHAIPIDLTWGPLDLVLVDRLSLSQIDCELLQDEDKLERNTASTGPLLATLFVQALDKKKCSVCDVMNPLTAIKCVACTSKFSLECTSSLAPPAEVSSPKATDVSLEMGTDKSKAPDKSLENESLKMGTDKSKAPDKSLENESLKMGTDKSKASPKATGVSLEMGTDKSKAPDKSLENEFLKMGTDKSKATGVSLEMGTNQADAAKSTAAHSPKGKKGKKVIATPSRKSKRIAKLGANH
jgi:hypothetical protein